MDIFWIVLGGIFIAVGIIGCFIPILPGPPLAFIGLWIQQIKSQEPFSTKFLWLWAGITLLVTAMDYWVPVYSTKKFGGSKYGIWGCTIGLFLGLWMGPFGIIIGPFLGAFIGEILANQNSGNAFQAAIGSFIGFLLSTLFKLIACLVMLWYWVESW
ncbi:MAG TPA: DUF456 domain-containing protein [Cyclobacteriaceae bacterium]|nr:DUF456 domain-containing protein [Cyclobacteriaceae bacterium]